MIPYLICTDCKHFLGDGKCNAFPVEIPLIIISGKNDHTEPLPEQDNDIVFEPIKEAV